MALETILKKFREYAAPGEGKLLEKAYQFGEKAHAKQKRASGDPYFVHCEAVVGMLLNYHLDETTLVAALLHDVLEDTGVSEQTMRREFGDEVTNLILGVTKLDRMNFSSQHQAQAENWRKMLLATAQDIRVILIKMADRLHNMTTLHHLNRKRQMRIARETQSLYAPLAHRLGMNWMKSKLEDLAFEYLEPEKHQDLERKILARLPERERKLKAFTDDLEKRLLPTGIQHRLLSRSKSTYSIFQKMQRQRKPFEDIQDAIACRIITDTVSNCYAILGIVHTAYHPVTGTFTDYISMPKMNLYQSIHTTIVSPTGDHIEVQIRSEKMHQDAEFGIAAHWRYKTGEQRDDNLEEKLDWLRQWIEYAQDLDNPREFIDSLKTDLEFDQVFIFTPKGDVKILPKGATPLDFAFAIHTDIGLSCVGARVNKKMVKLEHKLKSGDIVEIQTRRNSHPKKDWVKIVKTARARSKIRNYLRKEGKIK